MTTDPFEAKVRDAFHRIGESVPVGVAHANVSVVPLRSTLGRRRFLIAGVAAAAATLAGLTVIAKRPRSRPTASSMIEPPRPTWHLVIDQFGVLTAPTGEPIDSASAGVGVAANPNSLLISDVTSTSLGLVAVGSEGMRFGTVGAIWTSPDGVSWSRIEDNGEVFGSRDRTRTSPGGATVSHVEALGGRVVALGSIVSVQTTSAAVTSTSRPAAWWSPDLSSWARVDLPSPTGSDWSITAFGVAHDQFLAFGIDLAPTRTGQLPALVAWSSRDGVTWTRSTISVDGTAFAESSEIRDVIATSDGYLAVGTTNSRAAAWISSDAINWHFVDLPDRPLASDEISIAGALARSRGTIVAVGSRLSKGAGYGSTGGPVTIDGHAEIAMWSSIDGIRWQGVQLPPPAAGKLQIPGPIAADDTGFVIVSQQIQAQTYVSTTMTSANGIEWATYPTNLPGARTALAATPYGWIAAGSAASATIDQDPPGPGDQRNNASIWRGT